MTMPSEIKSLKRLFSKKNEKPFRKNCFMNREPSFCEYPNILKLLDDNLPSNFVSEIAGKPSTIKSNHFSCQWHQASVESHSDDLYTHEYIQILIVDSMLKVDYHGYDTRPVFNYVKPEGAKISVHVNQYDVFIFDASKPHSVIFYGEEYLVVMRSVWKNSKPEQLNS